MGNNTLTALEKIQKKAQETSNKNISQTMNDDDVILLSISKIKPNPYQPRKLFNKEKLQELSDSIIKHGLLQAISVAKIENEYILIAGERRLRAHKMADLKTIRAVILDNVNEVKLRELSLIENIQRDDLTIMEEAIAFKELNNTGLSLREIEKSTSKKKSYISNVIKLTQFKQECIDYILENQIKNTRILLLILQCQEDSHLKLIKRLKDNNLSLAQVEKILENQKNSKPSKEILEIPYPYDLPEILGVKIKQTNKKINLSIDINEFNENDDKMIMKYIRTILKKSKENE